MRKITTFLSALVLISIVTAPQSHGSVLPVLGKSCNQPMRIQTSGKTKLVCTITGPHAAIWKKYVPSPTAPSATAPSATTPSAVTPTAAPTAKASEPTSFSDLYTNRQGLARAAWEKLNSAISTSAASLPTVEIYRGPNTPQYDQNPQAALSTDLQLFPNASVPKKVVIIYWSHADMAWATAKAQVLMGASDYSADQAQTVGLFVDCYTATSCKVGHAFIGSDGTAYMGIGLPDSLAKDGSDSALPLGQLEGVEFYHALEIYPYYLNHNPFSTIQNKTTPNFPPQWFAFGSENFTTTVLQFGKNQQGFVMSMNTSGWLKDVIPNFSQDWLNQYLDSGNAGNSWSDDGYTTAGTNVSMGQNLMEILIALKGPSVLTDLPALMSQGKSFVDAFQAEFGTSWQSAAPEIAKVVWDKYQNRY